MKKKISIIAILIAIAIGIICFLALKPNKYKISKIIMSDSISNVELTSNSKIEQVMDILTNHKNAAEQTTYEQKDGFAFTFEIYYENGTEEHIVINSEEMIYDGIGYVSSEKFCQELREFYKKVYR